MKPASNRRRAFLALVTGLCALLGLAACGSTKVLTADKTIVYKERIYNVSSVREFRPLREATLADGSTRDLAAMDDGAIKALFKDQGSMRVNLSFMLDDTELVYARGSVDSYREYDRLEGRFRDARKEIERFLADARKTQLKLS